MAMLTHNQIWTAIDRLAARAKLSPSGLARKAGLDPTTFNKSKRVTPEGRQRWPSTESVAKALQATGTKFDTFVTLITDAGRPAMQNVPLIGFAQAGAGGFFDDGGFPVGKGGPMFWAEAHGLKQIVERLDHWHARTGKAVFEPAPLLRSLAASGGSFAELREAAA